MSDVGRTGPALGFGCAGLQLTESRRANERLLGAAWDAGVTWFDVARSYSYGTAEGILGSFLRYRRSDAVIVTKFGISPPHALMRNRGVRAAAAIALRLAPQSRARGLAAANARVVRGDFSLLAAKRSLHTSLKQLRTDYVDALLLHEADVDDTHRADLCAWLQECVDRGTILRWGIATHDIDKTAEIVRDTRTHVTTIQIPDSLLRPAVQRFPDLLHSELLISHSMIKNDVPLISQWLTADSKRLHEWSDQIGMNLQDTGALVQLVLANALARPYAGAVVYSSRDERHCAQAAKARMVSEDSLSAFTHMITLISAS